MKLTIVILLLLISVILSAQNNTKKPQILNGVLDLSKTSIKSDISINLNGNWKMWWNNLITPQDFLYFQNNSKNYSLVKLPGVWNKTINPDTKKVFNEEGYASFALKIIFPENINEENLAIQLGQIWSAYELYIINENNNDIKKIASSGVVSSNKKLHIPQTRSQITKKFKAKGIVHLLLRVSNYSYYKSGPEGIITLGIQKQHENNYLIFIVRNAAIIGILFIMGLYHLGLYSQRRKDRTNLYFSIICLSLVILQFISRGFLSLFIPEASSFYYELQVKLYYLGMYFTLFALNGFITNLVPNIWTRKPSQLLTVITIIYSFLTIFTNAKFFSSFLSIYQVVLLSYMSIGLGLLIKESLLKNKIAQTSLLGFFIFVLTVVNDILVGKVIIQSVILSPYGFIAFIFIQSYLLAKKFSDTYEQNELLLEEIKLKEKERTEFFHNTSHELRTPLNGILGFCDLMPLDKMQEQSKIRIQKIKNLAISLKDQVNTILDLAKDQTGSLTANLSLHKPIEIFENIQILAEGLSQKKDKINFLFVTNGDIPNEIISDDKMILGIARNLLGNSFKFTENENTNNIKISFEFKDDHFVLSVTDTGIGIPEKDQKDIYKEFKQVQGDARRKYEGTGLGLSIVKKYAEALQAQIELDSGKDNGCSFTLNFPYLKSEDIIQVKDISETIQIMSKVDEVVESKIIEDIEKQKEENTRFKILVTDDNEINLEVFEGILNSQGYQVILCNGGKDCIDYLNENHIDLLILDLMMPEVSGEDVLKHVRDTPSLTNLPVMLVTARASRSDKIEGLTLGADDYLAKPIDKDELLLKTQAILIRLELARTMEVLLEREKMAQVGDMIGEISHEIKNLHIGSSSDFQQEQKDGLSYLLFKSIEKYEDAKSMIPHILEKKIKFVGSKDLVNFEIPRNLPKDLELPVKRLSRSIASTDMEQIDQMTFWKYLLNQDPDKIYQIYQLFFLTDSILSFFDKAERTSDLVKSVLDFTRADSMIQACRLYDVVQGTLNLLGKKIYYEGVEIDNQLDEDDDPLVSFVKSDLNQVVLNLVGNAIDAFKNSDQSTKKISFNILKDDNKNTISLTIKDNGSGIPNEIKNKIFERNFSTKGDEGSGLGLFICKKIVQRNDADISLESKVGQTEFTIKINLK
jgi:signal transduction histidine kinase